MAEDVAKLLVQVSATTELLRQNLAKAEREIGGFVTNTDRKLAKAESNFDRLGKAGGRLKSVFSGFTTGAFAGLLASVSGGAIIAATRNALDFAGSLGEVADSLGVSTKFLQEFRFAAQQNGSSLEQADTALGKFTLTIGKAREGSKAQIEAFKQLDISLTDASGRARETDQVFLDVANAIAAIDDPARQSAIGAELFGKGFRTLLPLLKQGADGFKLTAKEAERLGVVLSDKQIQDADVTADKIAALTDALKVRFAGVVAENATEIGQLANALADLVDSGIKDIDRFVKAYRQLTSLPAGQQLARLTDGIANEFVPTPLARGRTGPGQLFDSQQLERRLFGKDVVNRPTASTANSRAAQGAFPAPAKRALPGLKPLGGVSFFTAQDSAASDFGQLIESLQFGIPLAETFGGKLKDISAVEAEIGGDAKALIESYREANRLSLLRAEGRNDEAEEAEALARVGEEVARIDGLSVEQRTKLLALAEAITVEGIRQRRLAEDRLDLENQLIQAQEADARAAEEGAFNAATRQLEEYKRQGEEANAYLADTFETLFTDGLGGVWRQFKAEGLRALAQLLANIIAPADGGGFGGGLLGAIGSIFGAIGGGFGGGGFGGGGFGGGKGPYDIANIKGRASGGPVSAGQPYIVGEKRPELFVPRLPGTIIPNLNSIGGGGGMQFTINAPGATAETVMMIRRELRDAAPQIVAAARNATARDFNRQRLP